MRVVSKVVDMLCLAAMADSVVTEYSFGAAGSESVICVTAGGSYGGPVRPHFADRRQVKVGRKSKIDVKEIAVGWGRLVVDEAHLEVNKMATKITLIRSRNAQTPYCKPRIIFLTGTPFERGPGQIANWMALLEDNNCNWENLERLWG